MSFFFQRSLNKKSHPQLFNRGFTLVEMLVSTTLFTMVLLMIVGALISLNDASRKSRTVRLATDNLSAAIDSMSRTIRTGTKFHCGCVAPFDTALSCPMTSSLGAGGDTCLAFVSQDGVLTQYKLIGSQIKRTTDGGTTWLDLTDPALQITKTRFFVMGTGQHDQPIITMLIQGVASTTQRTTTNFNIQTSVSARMPNLDFLP